MASNSSTTPSGEHSEEAAAETRPADPQASCWRWVPQGHGETILIVEDEPALLEVTSRRLRRNGYEVAEASSARQALPMIAVGHFDLLLTDLVMPGMSGPDLADRTVAIDPGTAVLYMSGYSGGVAGPRRSFDDRVVFIQKPFTEITLLTKVRDALAARALEDRPGPSGVARSGRLTRPFPMGSSPPGVALR